jgi:hypothetical protein
MGRLIAYYEPKDKTQAQTQVEVIPPQVVNR